MLDGPPASDPGIASSQREAPTKPWAVERPPCFRLNHGMKSRRISKVVVIVELIISMRCPSEMLGANEGCRAEFFRHAPHGSDLRKQSRVVLCPSAYGSHDA